MPHTTTPQPPACPAFLHRPRPAHSVRNGVRHFGKTERITAACDAKVQVSHIAQDQYTVISLHENDLAIYAVLTPAQARELAAALIDAAHDIDSGPGGLVAAAQPHEGQP